MFVCMCCGLGWKIEGGVVWGGWNRMDGWTDVVLAAAACGQVQEGGNRDRDRVSRIEGKRAWRAVNERSVRERGRARGEFAFRE